MGRLTDEPKSFQTQSGTKMTRYTLAVDRFSKDDKKAADFISCITFGKISEFAGQYLHKGTKIVVQGNIKTGNYTDKDGKKVYTTDVIVTNHFFCESKATQQAQVQTQQTPPPANPDFVNNIPEGITEELPF